MARFDDEIKLSMERAITDLQEAKARLESGQYDVAASQAAESAFHTGTALLLDEDIETSQHGDVIARIQEVFVNGRLLTKEQGADLNWLFAMRNLKNRRESSPVTSQEAQRAVEIAESFFAAAKVILEG